MSPPPDPPYDDDPMHGPPGPEDDDLAPLPANPADAIRAALDDIGGDEILAYWTRANPAQFLALLARLAPPPARAPAFIDTTPIIPPMTEEAWAARVKRIYLDAADDPDLQVQPPKEP